MRHSKLKIYPMLLSLTLVFEVSACHAASEVELAVACLNDSYTAIQTAATPDKKSSIASKYLKCFPSQFSEFEALFGYDTQTKTAGPLYKEYLKYFNFLGENYTYFDKAEFAKKFIDLAIDARGNHFSDAEELLQTTSLAPLKRDPGVGFSVLSEHSDNEIKSYWNFVLDALVPGSKRTEYACPVSFVQTKACQVLSEIKLQKE